MDTVMPPQEATLQRLIRRLPIPIVLFAATDGSCFPNERLAHVYEPGQLASPEFEGLAQRPPSTLEAVELRRNDRSAIKAWVETIAVPVDRLFFPLFQS